MNTKKNGIGVIAASLLILLSGCGNRPELHQAPLEVSVPVQTNQATQTPAQASALTPKQQAFAQTPAPVQEKLLDADWYIKAYGEKNPTLCSNIKDEPLKVKCTAEAQRQ